MEIRDRYAPSPTGLQHIGGLRTALFNYLFARSQNGKFLLRLEDTDRTRFDESFVKNIYETFSWLNIKWDEGPDTGGEAGPYIQSQRFDIYKKYAQELLDNDKAYYCFCSAERLETVRKERESAHSSETGYDRFCRNIPQAEAAEMAGTRPHTIRLKIPLNEHTKFTDKLLGEIEWNNNDVNPDPVLIKSDGFPTYHLANVVDDHLMNISHILRAQEWLSSTPLHVIMYKAFGWQPPVFCHLPMVMGQDGKKLSKRHGATSIDELRKNGYLPQALINYVAQLGASYLEGKEIYSLDELAKYFSLDKLNKAPAIFDYQKLKWYNEQYIRAKTDSELAEISINDAIEYGLFGIKGDLPDSVQKDIFYAAMPLIKERVSFINEIPAKLAFLFIDPDIAPNEEFIPKKCDLQAAINLLTMGKEVLPAMARADDAGAEAVVKEKAQNENVKLGDLLMPLRVAITGSRVSPPLFGSIHLLGEVKCMQRIENALAKLKK